MDKVQIHENLCKSMHILYKKKNADYGDSFAQMRHRYPNVIAMKLWEKVNRLATLMDNPESQQVNDESIEDTLMDIANYAIMELTERKLDKQGEDEPNLENLVKTFRDIDIDWDAIAEGVAKGFEIFCEQVRNATQVLFESTKGGNE